MTDSEVAKRVGRSRLAVQARRGQIGIRRYGSDLRPWTDQEEKLLGTVPDKELVSRLNRGYEAIAFRRQKLRIPPCRPQAWQPEEEAILGTQSDEEIGRILGRTKVAVRARRCELKIPNGGGVVHRHWTKEEDQLLGKAADELVAKQLGRTVNSVSLRRTRLKIPAPKRALR